MRESDEEDAPGFFQMWRTDGTILKRSASAPAAGLPSLFGTPDKAEVLECDFALRFRWSRHRTQVHPADIQREHPPSVPNEVILVVASDRGELNETLTTLAFALLGCGAGLLAVTVVIVPRLLRRELAPLDALAEQATHINADSLATRFPPSRCRAN